MLHPAVSLHAPRTGSPTAVSLTKFTWLLLGLLFSVGCRHPAQKPSAAPVPSASPIPASKNHRSSATPRTIEPVTNSSSPLVGKVRVIGAHGSFVLIETPSAFVTSAVPAGCLLRCRAPGVGGGISTGDLRVSPERRPPFLVADVVSGQPSVGDAAYVAPETATTPAPSTSAIPYSSVLMPPPSATPELQ